MSAVHESLVLKPRDPSIRDNNLWPDFTLTQARIVSPTSGANVNLLYASDTSPVTVTGRLENLPNDRLHYLLPRVSLPITIEVTNVGLFSYGQYEEGEVALWAAGLAGWFEIKPSRAYRDMFKEMVRAVECLYFAADLYRDLDKAKVKKMEVEEVFQQYAAEPEHKCANTDQAADVFRKHKEFLVTSMDKGREGVVWKQTQLQRWLQQETSEQNARDQLLVDESNGVQAKEETPNRRLPHAGKGKSILRPQSGALTIKGAKRRRSLNEELSGEGDATMEGAADRTLNGNAEVPSPSPMFQREEREKKPSRAGRGRPAKAMQLDKEDSSMTPIQDESDTAGQPQRPIPLLAARRPRNARQPKTMVNIVESPIPSYQPQGPGDVWTCTFDGCSHRVYAATEPEGCELIKEHFRDHAFSAQAQIDLVYKEERPYLPVGNLLRKIRELAALQRSSEATEAGANSNESAGWPSPVVRKY